MFSTENTTLRGQFPGRVSGMLKLFVSPSFLEGKNYTFFLSLIAGLSVSTWWGDVQVFRMINNI